MLWSRAEPERVGEVLLPSNDVDQESVFGRSPPAGGHGLGFVRLRPGSTVRTGPPRSAGISRIQWRIRPVDQSLAVDNLGRRPLLHNGVASSSVMASVGDRLEVAHELLTMVVYRPAELMPQRLPAPLIPEFGQADQFGLVGESPVAWELRRQLAFAAGREEHVLLTGPSGCGKELAARAVHAMSKRSERALVARNAATLPEGLIDAELFGNPRDYPNPGMPERPGLIGAADGSCLFLDEIGELSHTLQGHLLRVIDGGEYQRLGEARCRTADVRVIAATNRDPLELKHDLLPRLRLRINLPGLELRAEDIPLIARHLLRTMAVDDPQVAERVFPDGNVDAEPSWTSGFVAGLVTSAYAGHVRELQARLWEAIVHDHRPGLSVLPSAGAQTSAAPPADPPASDDSVDPQSITAEQIRAALAACDGSRDRTWRALGLRSRHQLVRLMRRHGIGRGGDGEGEVRSEGAVC